MPRRAISWPALSERRHDYYQPIKAWDVKSIGDEGDELELSRVHLLIEPLQCP
jgi:hypothetical protein